MLNATPSCRHKLDADIYHQKTNQLILFQIKGVDLYGETGHSSTSAPRAVSITGMNKTYNNA
jgi:hypothetical protein